MPGEPDPRPDNLSSLSPPTVDGGLAKDPVLESARNYTVAMALSQRKAEKDQKIAHSMLGRFMRTTNSGSIWWEAAYDRYKDLSKRLSIEAEAKDAIKAALAWSVSLQFCWMSLVRCVC